MPVKFHLILRNFYRLQVGWVGIILLKTDKVIPREFPGKTIIFPVPGNLKHRQNRNPIWYIFVYMGLCICLSMPDTQIKSKLVETWNLVRSLPGP